MPLPYIRDILGHVDLSTTEIYARASTEAKRKALEAVYDEVVSAELTEWNQTPSCSTGSPPSDPPPSLCAAIGRQPRRHSRSKADTTHNPALLIWVVMSSCA